MSSILMLAWSGMMVLGPKAVSSFAPRPWSGHRQWVQHDGPRCPIRPSASKQEQSPTTKSAAPPPPAILNGKRVMPSNILQAGLKGQDGRIAGVYALLSAEYTKGSDGWESVCHVGVSQDLAATLQALQSSPNSGVSDYQYVRALSFSFPQANAMQDVADDWKQKALDAGAELRTNVVDASLFLVDEDDDDEFDDDDDWSMESAAQSVADSVVSPFDQENSHSSSDQGETTTTELPTVVPSDPGSLELNQHTVDFVLNEVRPYLIADGGNCTVKNVDVDSKTVFLQLEGACGSCPSSTVTMQMGIERVLRENFGPDVKVEQVEDQDDKPTSLTMEAVQEEVDRIKPAIIAMGGVVRVLSADADTGVVKLQFRGASRVQQGLELAILDLPFVNAVQFVMGQEEDE